MAKKSEPGSKRTEWTADPTPLPTVKVASSVPAGATAVAEFAFSDRLNRIPGMGKAAAQRRGFSGESGSLLVIDGGDESDSSAVRVVCGLGESDSVDPERMRSAIAAFTRSVAKHRRVAVDLLGDDLADLLGTDTTELVGLVAEAAILANYDYVQLRSSEDAGPRLNTVTVCASGDLRAMRSRVSRSSAVADAVCFARDMVNAPGGTLTPERFAGVAAERARSAGLSVEVLDEESIAQENLGGILAVNKGSSNPPRLVKLTYDPPEQGPPSGTVALVGKGITFDSGGLSIKPADSMIGMKMDMGGAAAVIASTILAARLGLDVNVIATVPMAENMPSDTAQRPGDVLTQYGGITVEVINTDAEGRLILADAIVRAGEDNPDYLIDTATLTGAQMVALGTRTPGVMGTDEFRDRVARLSAGTGENAWPMPLPTELRAELNSRVADLVNAGAQRWGGMLLAGVFLKEFVPEGVQWAHIDIAGPAFNTGGAWGYNPKGGTGVPVRTILAVLEDIAANG